MEYVTGEWSAHASEAMLIGKQQHDAASCMGIYCPWRPTLSMVQHTDAFSKYSHSETVGTVWTVAAENEATEQLNHETIDAAWLLDSSTGRVQDAFSEIKFGTDMAEAMLEKYEDDIAWQCRIKLDGNRIVCFLATKRIWAPYSELDTDTDASHVVDELPLRSPHRTSSPGCLLHSLLRSSIRRGDTAMAAAAARELITSRPVCDSKYTVWFGSSGTAEVAVSLLQWMCTDSIMHPQAGVLAWLVLTTMYRPHTVKCTAWMAPLLMQKAAELSSITSHEPMLYPLHRARQAIKHKKTGQSLADAPWDQLMRWQELEELKPVAVSCVPAILGIITVAQLPWTAPMLHADLVYASWIWSTRWTELSKQHAPSIESMQCLVKLFDDQYLANQQSIRKAEQISPLQDVHLWPLEMVGVHLHSSLIDDVTEHNSTWKELWELYHVLLPLPQTSLKAKVGKHPASNSKQQEAVQNTLHSLLGGDWFSYARSKTTGNKEEYQLEQLLYKQEYAEKQKRYVTTVMACTIASDKAKQQCLAAMVADKPPFHLFILRVILYQDQHHQQLFSNVWLNEHAQFLPFMAPSTENVPTLPKFTAYKAPKLRLTPTNRARTLTTSAASSFNNDPTVVIPPNLFDDSGNRFSVTPPEWYNGVILARQYFLQVWQKKCYRGCNWGPGHIPVVYSAATAKYFINENATSIHPSNVCLKRMPNAQKRHLAIQYNYLLPSNNHIDWTAHLQSWTHAIQQTVDTSHCIQHKASLLRDVAHCGYEHPHYSSVSVHCTEQEVVLRLPHNLGPIIFLITWAQLEIMEHWHRQEKNGILHDIPNPNCIGLVHLDTVCHTYLHQKKYTTTTSSNSVRNWLHLVLKWTAPLLQRYERMPTAPGSGIAARITHTQKHALHTLAQLGESDVLHDVTVTDSLVALHVQTECTNVYVIHTTNPTPNTLGPTSKRLSVPTCSYTTVPDPDRYVAINVWSSGWQWSVLQIHGSALRNIWKEVMQHPDPPLPPERVTEQINWMLNDTQKQNWASVLIWFSLQMMIGTNVDLTASTDQLLPSIDNQRCYQDPVVVSQSGISDLTESPCLQWYHNVPISENDISVIVLLIRFRILRPLLYRGQNILPHNMVCFGPCQLISVGYLMRVCQALLQPVVYPGPWRCIDTDPHCMSAISTVMQQCYRDRQMFVFERACRLLMDQLWEIISCHRTHVRLSHNEPWSRFQATDGVRALCTVHLYVLIVRVARMLAAAAWYPCELLTPSVDENGVYIWQPRQGIPPGLLRLQIQYWRHWSRAAKLNQPGIQPHFSPLQLPRMMCCARQTADERWKQNDAVGVTPNSIEHTEIKYSCVTELHWQDALNVAVRTSSVYPSLEQQQLSTKWQISEQKYGRCMSVLHINTYTWAVETLLHLIRSEHIHSEATLRPTLVVCPDEEIGSAWLTTLRAVTDIRWTVLTRRHVLSYQLQDLSEHSISNCHLVLTTPECLADDESVKASELPVGMRKEVSQHHTAILNKKRQHEKITAEQHHRAHIANHTSSCQQVIGVEPGYGEQLLAVPWYRVIRAEINHTGSKLQLTQLISSWHELDCDIRWLWLTSHTWATLRKIPGDTEMMTRTQLVEDTAEWLESRNEEYWGRWATWFDPHELAWLLHQNGSASVSELNQTFCHQNTWQLCTSQVPVDGCDHLWSNYLLRLCQLIESQCSTPPHIRSLLITCPLSALLTVNPWQQCVMQYLQDDVHQIQNASINMETAPARLKRLHRLCQPREGHICTPQMVLRHCFTDKNNSIDKCSLPMWHWIVDPGTPCRVRELTVVSIPETQNNEPESGNETIPKCTGTGVLRSVVNCLHHIWAPLPYQWQELIGCWDTRSHPHVYADPRSVALWSEVWVHGAHCSISIDNLIDRFVRSDSMFSSQLLPDWVALGWVEFSNSSIQKWLAGLDPVQQKLVRSSLDILCPLWDRGTTQELTKWLLSVWCGYTDVEKLLIEHYHNTAIANQKNKNDQRSRAQQLVGLVTTAQLKWCWGRQILSGLRGWHQRLSQCFGSTPATEMVEPRVTITVVTPDDATVDALISMLQPWASKYQVSWVAVQKHSVHYCTNSVDTHVQEWYCHDRDQTLAQVSSLAAVDLVILSVNMANHRLCNWQSRIMIHTPVTPTAHDLTPKLVQHVLSRQGICAATNSCSIYPPTATTTSQIPWGRRLIVLTEAVRSAEITTVYDTTSSRGVSPAPAIVIQDTESDTEIADTDAGGAQATAATDTYAAASESDDQEMQDVPGYIDATPRKRAVMKKQRKEYKKQTGTTWLHEAECINDNVVFQLLCEPLV